jgi:ribosome-associated protein
MHETDNESPDFEEEGPSKSEMKRRMLALQQLGETLVNLPDKQLQRIPLEEEQLLDAIREARNIRSNSARRRHMQLIGKLMREIDPEPIATALAELHQSEQRNNDAFHSLEQLREDMLAAGANGVELAMQCWPQADRQHLRQLLLQHQREQQRAKPPAASRKLFRYLREMQALYGDDAG